LSAGELVAGTGGPDCRSLHQRGGRQHRRRLDAAAGSLTLLLLLVLLRSTND
jgi:hypothetical protein